MGRRRYAPEVKAQALRLMASGMTAREVGEHLEVPGSTVGGWVHRARANGTMITPVPAHLADDPAVPIEVTIRIRELEARLETLEANQAFLGKVSAFFAKQRPR